MRNRLITHLRAFSVLALLLVFGCDQTEAPLAPDTSKGFGKKAQLEVINPNAGILPAEIQVADATEVMIDIKPGTEYNYINPWSKGLITVAVLTTEDFDATTVDPLTVVFGPNSAAEFHERGHIEDIDYDGDLDLILHFKTNLTGIACGDLSATLTGYTVDEEPIMGSDDIILVKCE